VQVHLFYGKPVEAGMLWILHFSSVKMQETIFKLYLATVSLAKRCRFLVHLAAAANPPSLLLTHQDPQRRAFTLTSSTSVRTFRNKWFL